MQLLVQTIALGILMGGLYALMAVGLSLIFGVLRIVNFAHGALAMLGGYAAVLAVGVVGLSPYTGLLVAFVVAGIIGYFTNALCLRPIFQGRLERPGEYAIIITFILSQLFVGVALALFGGSYRNYPSLLPINIDLAGWVNVSGDRVFVFGLAIALLAGLMYVVYRTDLGRAWRALTQNREGAQVVGIDVMRFSNLAFAVGTALAGVAAVALGALYVVYPDLGSNILIKSFIVVIIGGMGSIWGALWAGLALGLVETLGSVYLASAYVDAYGFLFMIAVLLVAPQGLFGSKGRTI